MHVLRSNFIHPVYVAKKIENVRPIQIRVYLVRQEATKIALRIDLWTTRTNYSWYLN